MFEKNISYFAYIYIITSILLFSVSLTSLLFGHIVYTSLTERIIGL